VITEAEDQQQRPPDIFTDGDDNLVMTREAAAAKTLVSGSIPNRGRTSPAAGSSAITMRLLHRIFLTCLQIMCPMMLSALLLLHWMMIVLNDAKTEIVCTFSLLIAADSP